MKILIITRTFYPATNPRSFRSSELAKEFSIDHEVTVMLPTPSQSQHEYAHKYGFSIVDMGRLVLRPVGPSHKRIIGHLRNVIRRIGSLFIEYPDIELSWRVAQRLKELPDYDLVLSIAMPYTIHWGVSWAISRKKINNGTWVADCGDPYVGLKNDTFKKPFYFKYIEKWSFRKFDYISIPIEEARSHYFEEFHSKIRIIPQAFKFEDIPKSDNEVISRPYPHFVYGGSLNMKVRNPRELIEYLLVKNEPFKFVVYTPNGHIINDLVERSNGRVEVRTIVPRYDFLRAIHEYDFVVNIDYSSDGQRPSKLIDYALVGKPILSLRTGAFDSTLVDEFMKGDYTRAHVVEKIDQYRIENVVSQFMDLVQIKRSQTSP